MPPGEERIRIKQGQLNAGSAKARDVVAFIMDEGLKTCTLNEMSDRKDIIRELQGVPGVQVIQRPLPMGAPAVAIVSSGLHVVGSRLMPLYHGGDIGPGTGPDHGKPKFLLVGRYYLPEANRHLVVGNIHCYAGQKWGDPHDKDGNLRAEISRDMVAKSVGFMEHFKAPKWLNGDFNATIQTLTMRPLFDAGWTSTHSKLGPMPTHDNWTPDHICWPDDDNRIIVVRQYRIPKISDHDGIVGVFDLKVGKDRAPAPR